MVLRLIAPSTTTVAATTAIASPAVEPATAIPVVTVVATVSETPVVAARGPTSAASTATTTGAKEDACDHYDHDHDQNCQERYHPNSPFTGFPAFRHQSTLERSVVTTLAGCSRTAPTPSSRGYASVWVRTHAGTCGSYTVQVARRDYLQRCEEWTRRRSLLWRVTRRARSCSRRPCGCSTLR